MLRHVDFARYPRSIQEGDHLILYAVGGQKRIFAIVKVIGEVEGGDDERWQYRLRASLKSPPVPRKGINLIGVGNTHVTWRIIGPNPERVVPATI